MAGFVLSLAPAFAHRNVTQKGNVGFITSSACLLARGMIHQAHLEQMIAVPLPRKVSSPAWIFNEPTAID